MRNSRRRLAVPALAYAGMVASALLFPPLARGQADPAEPAVDPAATAALERMGAYLRTVQAFQVEAATEREDVLENGLKVQLNGATSIVVRKPDRLRAEVASDWSDREYVYDGKSFTLLARRLEVYATVPAPPTLGELADVLYEKYDIELPLVDLFRWGNKVTAEGITAAVDLGPSTVDGTTCQHYAFRQEGLDWQIWIQLGDFPLPRRLILTTTTDEARPQFTATYRWNLAPSFNEETFVFDPPADAGRIVFTEIAEIE